MLITSAKSAFTARTALDEFEKYKLNEKNKKCAKYNMYPIQVKKPHEIHYIRTSLYNLISSKTLPVPLTTDNRGSSATCTGKPVLFLIC